MKLSTRVSGGLLLVLVSLLLATVACYSGQIPGTFELTPFYTETPAPTPEESQLNVGDIALAPVESGRAFFNLTIYPEPLDNSLLNSKAMCEGGSSAKVLYAAQGEGSDIFYLVNCVGSVGWASEARLAGPLLFNRNELAVTVAREGETNVPLLDEFTMQPAPAILQQCTPGTIVSVLDIRVADYNADGENDILYQVECPRGSRGLVADDQLVGPLEINVGDRALAIVGEGDDNETYQLSTEPGPITSETAVEGECTEGAVLTAEEARLVDDQVYYRLNCGDITGWANSDRFIGPFRFGADMNALIYVEPIASFNTGEAAAEDGETIEGAEELAAIESDVIYTIPPAFLTDNPGPAVFESEDTESNVVGVCPNRTVAYIDQYTGAEGQIYYQVTCGGCMADQVETEQQVIKVGDETSVGEISVCSETQDITGWIEQASLHGPLPFVPDELVQFTESSYTLETTEDGETFVRLPTTTSGAYALTPNSQHVEFAGRCPVDSEFRVTDFATEESRTGTGLTIYYQIECTGQPASYTQIDQGGRTSSAEVAYDADASETITGWVLARDLQSAEE